jgi:hypothetical protein
MLKIYQSRHPDINAEAHAAFSVLAFVVLIGVISVFEDTLTFRIIFSAIHLLACLALSAQVYYMGRWKLSMYICFQPISNFFLTNFSTADFGVFKRIYMVFWNDFQAGPSNVKHSSSILILI